LFLLCHSPESPPFELLLLAPTGLERIGPYRLLARCGASGRS